VVCPGAYAFGLYGCGGEGDFRLQIRGPAGEGLDSCFRRNDKGGRFWIWFSRGGEVKPAVKARLAPDESGQAPDAK